MPKRSPSLALRASGALVGLAAGRALVLGDEIDGSVALTAMLAEELSLGRRDLRTLAQRWVTRHREDPRGIDGETAAALVHIARHDAPPAVAAGQGSDALVRSVPVALAAFDAPRTLVSATYHVAALTHPDPLVAWSAVAVNVALARFLQGRRDFVPDLIEALRSNEVPEALLAAVRRVPLPTIPTDRSDPVPPGRALSDTEAVLRLAYHEPLLERGVREAAALGAGGAARAGLAAALLGARDGLRAIPPSWTSRVDGSILGAFAVRLVRIDPATASPA